MQDRQMLNPGETGKKGKIRQLKPHPKRGNRDAPRMISQGVVHTSVNPMRLNEDGARKSRGTHQNKFSFTLYIWQNHLCLSLPLPTCPFVYGVPSCFLYFAQGESILL